MWPFKKRMKPVEPPTDLNKPVTNPALLKALDAFEAGPSDQAWGVVLHELNAAHFIVATILDEAGVRHEAGGRAVFKKGSKIKVMVLSDPPRLLLFTDWDRLRMYSTEQSIQGMIMPGPQAWRLAADYGRAVVNPGSPKQFPILPEVLDWLLKSNAPAQQA